MPGQKREARLRADVPGIHVLAYVASWFETRGVAALLTMRV
jgi:hypothetical protein